MKNWSFIFNQVALFIEGIKKSSQVRAFVQLLFQLFEKLVHLPRKTKMVQKKILASWKTSFTFEAGDKSPISNAAFCQAAPASSCCGTVQVGKYVMARRCRTGLSPDQASVDHFFKLVVGGKTPWASMAAARGFTWQHDYATFWKCHKFSQVFSPAVIFPCFHNLLWEIGCWNTHCFIVFHNPLKPEVLLFQIPGTFCLPFLRRYRSFDGQETIVWMMGSQALFWSHCWGIFKFLIFRTWLILET